MRKLKLGDIIVPTKSCNYLTEGKEYEIVDFSSVGNPKVVHDKGREISIFPLDDAHINGVWKTNKNERIEYNRSEDWFEIVELW